MINSNHTWLISLQETTLWYHLYWASIYTAICSTRSSTPCTLLALVCLHTHEGMAETMHIHGVKLWSRIFTLLSSTGLHRLSSLWQPVVSFLILTRCSTAATAINAFIPTFALATHRAFFTMHLHIPGHVLIRCRVLLLACAIVWSINNFITSLVSNS